MLVACIYGKSATHLDSALMGTASLTRSVRGLLAATVSFFPPFKANTVAPTVNSVPRVRYSFLMLRPRMTLSTVVSKTLRHDKETY